MSNVVPPSEQKTNWTIHRAHFVVGISIAAVGLSLLASLSLLPSYLALQSEAAAPPPADTSVSQDQTALVNAQTLLTALEPMATTSTPMAAIAAAIAIRPKGVVVTDISYTAGEPSSLMLVGSSDGRTVINDYRVRLQNEGHFASVALPVGDLLGAAGGKFSITLTGHF